jgi:hypothetical protein
LAEARIARAVNQDWFNSARLLAEFNLIELKANVIDEHDPERYAKASKAIGSNDKDRERAYGIACEGDDNYRAARAALRGSEADVLLLEASLEGLKAARRERELAISERYLDLTGEKRGIFNLPHLSEMAS